MSTNNKTMETPTQTDAEKLGLMGAVKHVNQFYYAAFEKEGRVYLSNQEGGGYEEKNLEYTFRENGTKISFIKRGVGGDKQVYSYNEQGIETDITSYDGLGKISWKIVNIIDEEGNIIEQTSYSPVEKMTSKTVNVYGSNGLPSEIIRYGEDGELMYDAKLSYNADGKRTECKQADKDGVFTSWSKYNFNEKGQMIENISLDPEGKVKDVTSLEGCYDKDGNFSWDNRYGITKKKEDLYTNRIEEDSHENWIKKIVCYRDVAIFVYIREIEYFGEELKSNRIDHSVFNLPLKIESIRTEVTGDDDITRLNLVEKETPTEMEPEDSKWLAERISQTENFPIQQYYLLKFNEYPTQVLFSNQVVDALALLGELKKDLKAEIIYSYETNDSIQNGYLIRYILSFPESPGYLLSALHISEQDSDEYEVPEFIHSYHNHGFDGAVHISQFMLLRPSDASGKREEYGIENDLEEYMYKCTIKRIPDKPHIHMVEVTPQGTFGLESHPAKDNFEILDLDVQYGYGFSKFHHSLMARFKNESQGLVLFHGLPGTGKTYYIRHLLREMAISNKIVIYMPPNMVDHLVEPSFMTFLSQTVADYSSEGQFCVLLIEDAEPLLASRSSDTRIQGVTNLLNMTDGLLNDMLKLQIICTFNVELKHLDAALLRPGRLIARKEFKALQELDANLLAQRLGIKHHFTEPATLSEIYAKLKNKNTLIHDEY